METITLTISAQTLKIIGVGLQELPYKVAVLAITEIDRQVKAALEKVNVGTSSTAGGADQDARTNEPANP